MMYGHLIEWWLHVLGNLPNFTDTCQISITIYLGVCLQVCTCVHV